MDNITKEKDKYTNHTKQDEVKALIELVLLYGGCQKAVDGIISMKSPRKFKSAKKWIVCSLRMYARFEKIGYFNDLEQIR